MATTRAITLGQGVNTLGGSGGAPKRLGALMLTGDDAKIIETQNSIDLEQTNYNTKIITNYTSLSEALKFQLGVTAALTAEPVITLEAKFFEKVELSKQRLSLLIKSTTTTRVTRLPDNMRLTNEARATLQSSQPNFVETYGNEYISDISYGKSLYVLIQFTNIDETELEEIHAILRGNLHPIPSTGPDRRPNAEIKLSIEHQLKKSIKNTIVDITIDYTGVKINPPDIGTDLDKLALFITEYNNPKNFKETIIGFATQSYATACLSINNLYKDASPKELEILSSNPDPTLTAARILHDRIERARDLIVDCNKGFQQLRLLIPTIEKFGKGLKKIHFEESADKEKVVIISSFLKEARELSSSLLLLTGKIQEHKVDPDMLYRMLLSYRFQAGHKVSEDKSLVHDEVGVRDQLRSLINEIQKRIIYIEDTIDTFSLNLSVDIINIHPGTPDFHLSSLPSTGANVLWKIHFPDGDKLKETQNIKFNIEYKIINNSNWFKQWWSTEVGSWRTEYYAVSNGVETRLKFRQQDLVRVRFNDPRYAARRDFVIIAQIIGPQAFDVRNSRYATKWLKEAFSSLESKNTPAQFPANAFYFTPVPLQPIPKSDSEFSLDDILEVKSSWYTKSVAISPIEEKEKVLSFIHSPQPSVSSPSTISSLSIFSNSNTTKSTETKESGHNIRRTHYHSANTIGSNQSSLASTLSSSSIYTQRSLSSSSTTQHPATNTKQEAVKIHPLSIDNGH